MSLRTLLLISPSTASYKNHMLPPASARFQRKSVKHSDDGSLLGEPMWPISNPLSALLFKSDHFHFSVKLDLLYVDV